MIALVIVAGFFGICGFISHRVQSWPAVSAWWSIAVGIGVFIFVMFLGYFTLGIR